MSLRKILRVRVRNQLSQYRCLFLLPAMSSRVYLLFPSRGREPPPTLRDRLNPHLSLQRRLLPIPRYVKHPDVALYPIGPLFLLPTPSSPHCTLKVSEHDSIWQSSAAHSDERPHHKSLVFNVVSVLSHRGISSARLYEVIRWSSLLRCAPMIRSKTRWCTVRSLA